MSNQLNAVDSCVFLSKLKIQKHASHCDKFLKDSKMGYTGAVCPIVVAEVFKELREETTNVPERFPDLIKEFQEDLIHFIFIPITHDVIKIYNEMTDDIRGLDTHDKLIIASAIAHNCDGLVVTPENKEMINQKESIKRLSRRIRERSLNVITPIDHSIFGKKYY